MSTPINTNAVMRNIFVSILLMGLSITLTLHVFPKPQYYYVVYAYDTDYAMGLASSVLEIKRGVFNVDNVIEFIRKKKIGEEEAKKIVIINWKAVDNKKGE